MRAKHILLALLAVFLIFLGSISSGATTPVEYPAVEPTGNPASLHKVLIGFRFLPGAAEEALVRAQGGAVKYRYHLVPAIAATIPEAAINGLLRNPNITRIEPDGLVHAIDAELDNAWGVARIGAGVVHEAGGLVIIGQSL